MKKSIIWAIVVVVIIIGGLWIFARSGEDQVEEEVIVVPTSTPTASPDPTPESRVEAATTHSLDTQSSRLSWEASRIVGASHTGTVAFKSGSLTFEDGVPAAGQFVVDMTSITEAQDNQRFLGHLQSDDFFAVEQYPESHFVLTSATADTWTGDLTIRDQTVPVDIPVTVTETPTGLTVVSNLSLDRTQWGINFDSGSIFQNLGDKAIKDEVELTASLSLETIAN